MNSIYRICIIFIVLALHVPSHVIYAKSRIIPSPFGLRLKERKKLDNNSLKSIIQDHQLWLKTNGKQGRKADLSHTDLEGVNLNKAILQGAILNNSDLAETNLSKANLKGSNLQVANMHQADLQGANLSKADLQWTHLIDANLKHANATQANLKKANLRHANLQKANLYGAMLDHTILEDAVLQEADLYKANLQGARLVGANLKGAYLDSANLQGTVFELQPNGLPNIPSVAKAKNLSLLTYETLPHSLVELREAFKKSGLRKQEREVTYAIKHAGFIKAKANGDWLTKAEVWMGWFFFETTCKWGMEPERPLLILGGLIFLLTFLYGYAISAARCSEDKNNGIWKVWLAGRIRSDLGNRYKRPLDDYSPKCLWYGFRFSLSSAFHIGWRDINVGSWIERIQCDEYRLQATGWARTISGLQSLISVYLLALSILAYFGRPFESY